VIDCVDAPMLARFWAEALDGYAVRPYDDAEIARLAERGHTPETDPAVAVDGPGPTLFLQQMPEREVARNRIHFDLVGQPRSDEVARLCKLGATVRDERETETIMQDPEGNAFCVRNPD
jgi:hypothetical protein